jgi:hypothetical protein
MPVVTLLLLCLLDGAAASSQPSSAAIDIRNDPPVIDRVMFNRQHPPAAMPKLRANEAALTQCDFRCRAGVGYRVVSDQRMGDHWHARIAIGRVELETNLTDTIYLPMMAPTLLRAHEEGHREMNERIYKQADVVAQQTAADVLARQWEGDGDTATEAEKAASNAAIKHLCDIYLDATASRASRLGDIYDRLTDHGRNQLYVANAIRLSFLEERQPTTRSAELLHPTTVPAQ